MNYHALTAVLAVLPLIVICLLIAIPAVDSIAARIGFAAGVIVVIATAVGLFSYWATLTGNVDGMACWYVFTSLVTLIVAGLVVATLADY